MNILEKLLEIKAKLIVPKSKYNQFGNYYYRSLEDIQEALKPFEKKHKVVVLTTTKTIIQDGIPFVEAKAYIKDVEDPKAKPIESEDSALIDVQQKGQQMPQRSGTASSYAKKYALGNLFGLDDSKDSDDPETNSKLKAPSVGKKAKPTGDFAEDILTVKDTLAQGRKWEDAERWLKSSNHYDAVALAEFKGQVDA